MIVDTGPLVLLLAEHHDSRYEKCQALFEACRGELVTTYPCLTEAMHHLGDWHHRSGLWNWILDNSLVLYDLSKSDLVRMGFLMQKYSDAPMDFADASLIATAETRNSNKIFTLDGDFTVYRFRDRSPFDIFP